MFINKISYFFLFILLLVFYVLYADILSFLILILAIALPIIMYIYLIIISRNIDFDINFDKIAAQKDSDIELKINIKNYSNFPISNSLITIEYKNLLTNETSILTSTIPIQSHTSNSLNFIINSCYCGNLLFELKSIILYDYLKLFSKKIKINKSKEITVLPNIYHIDPHIDTNTNFLSDSNIFSKTKSGDDCSEIFNLRDYVAGDKINRIHWKLSIKQDNLIVKDYSFPIHSSVILIFENNYNNNYNLMDLSIETLMSISQFLVENDIAHHIGWFNHKVNSFLKEDIFSNDDFAIFLGKLFKTTASPIFSNTLNQFQLLDETTNYSHIIYISSTTSKEILHNFSTIHNESKKTYLYISEEKKLPDYFSNIDRINIIPVLQNKINQSLHTLTI